MVKILKSLSLTEYQAVFHSKRIDGRALQKMTMSDLEKLGMGMDDQNILMSVIKGELPAYQLVES